VIRRIIRKSSHNVSDPVAVCCSSFHRGNGSQPRADAGRSQSDCGSRGADASYYANNALPDLPLVNQTSWIGSIHRINVAIAVEIVVAGAELFRVELEQAVCEHHLSRSV
jgi:hypothetical protein